MAKRQTRDRRLTANELEVALEKGARRIDELEARGRQSEYLLDHFAPRGFDFDTEARYLVEDDDGEFDYREPTRFREKRPARDERRDRGRGRSRDDDDRDDDDDEYDDEPPRRGRRDSDRRPEPRSLRERAKRTVERDRRPPTTCDDAYDPPPRRGSERRTRRDDDRDDDRDDRDSKPRPKGERRDVGENTGLSKTARALLGENDTSDDTPTDIDTLSVDEFMSRRNELYAEAAAHEAKTN